MYHIMIDTETLGLSPDSTILSIGAVCVEEHLDETFVEVDEFYRKISVSSNKEAGRKVSASTVEWWKETNPSMFWELLRGGWELSTVLAEFEEWVLSYSSPKLIWACGTDFDIPLLSNAYGGKPPWKYHAVRDFRTLREGFGHLVDLEPNPELHNALSDARNQMANLVKILKALKRLEQGLECPTEDD